MKRRSLIRWLPILAVSRAEALSPLASEPLEEQVRQATHVFVGVTTEARYAHVGFELIVARLEPLFPAGWNPTTLRVHYEQYGLDLEAVRRDLVGRRWVFVTPASGPDQYTASGPSGSIQPIDRLKEIKRLLRSRKA